MQGKGKERRGGYKGSLFLTEEMGGEREGRGRGKGGQLEGMERERERPPRTCLHPLI